MSSIELPFQMYGIILASAIGLGSWVANYISRKANFSTELISEVLVWMVIPGIIGARIYHVLDFWQYYRTDIFQTVAVWNGGLGIFGALLGGLIGLILFSRRKKLSVTQICILFDIAALVTPLSQSIGRWGNYVNQELYGYPTTLPWGIYITEVNRLPGFEQIPRYHPLFLYESIASLVLFGCLYCLWSIYKVKLGTLRYLGSYFIGYGLIRFILEFFRLDRLVNGGQTFAQVSAFFLIGIGILILCIHRLQFIKRIKNHDETA